MTTAFQERVYALCSRVPKGKVTTYKYIARRLKSGPRAVGQALKVNPYAPKVPCHRVVKSDRTLGGFAGIMDNPQKTRMLRAEGVRIINGKVDEDAIHKFD